MKKVVRVKGIEPSPQAWEARILPLNYTRSGKRFCLIPNSSPLKEEKLSETFIFWAPELIPNLLNFAKKALALLGPRDTTRLEQRV